MKISREEAQRIADLAHLEFDAAGLDRMAGEMTKILDYIDQLRQLDVAAVVSVDSAPTPMREDEPHQPLDRADVEANAPDWRDGFFVVPPVL